MGYLQLPFVVAVTVRASDPKGYSGDQVKGFRRPGPTWLD